MSTVVWILGVSLFALAVSRFGRYMVRRMSDPEKIRAAIDAHYQQRLAQKSKDLASECEMDFVFSAPTAAAAGAVESALVSLGYTVGVEKQPGAGEWIIEARHLVNQRAIDFAASRKVFRSVCEPVGAMYIGPGQRGLALVGIKLQNET